MDNFYEILTPLTTKYTRATAQGTNITRSNLEIRRNFFSCRATKVWNALPENVKSASSVESFKYKYDLHFGNTRA